MQCCTRVPACRLIYAFTFWTMKQAFAARLSGLTCVFAWRAKAQKSPAITDEV